MVTSAFWSLVIMAISAISISINLADPQNPQVNVNIEYDNQVDEQPVEPQQPDTPLTLDDFYTTYAPMLRYQFNEAANGAMVNSGTSGAVLNGNLTDGAGFGLPSNTDAGQGIGFDGVDSRITFPNHSSINGLNELSILVVAKPENVSGQDGLAGKVGEWSFRLQDSSILFSRDYSEQQALAITIPGQYVADTVYTFAATIGADRIPHIYVDGNEATYQQQVTGQGSPLLAESANFIGGSSLSAYTGALYDLAILNTALTGDAIGQYHLATQTGRTDAVIAFMGTSITLAPTIGFRPVTEAALRQQYADDFSFLFPGWYYNGGKTWELLWHLSDVLAYQPQVMVLDTIGTVNTAQGRAVIEGFIRRVRAESPSTRIVVLIQPGMNIELPVTNRITDLNDEVRAMAAHYDITAIDWTQRVYDLLNAGSQLSDLFADYVHPNATGHNEIAQLLLATLTPDFITGQDAWTGNLADYSRLYTSAPFEDVTNYTAIDATSGQQTGVWQVVNDTEAISTDPDATISFTFTGEAWGIQYDDVASHGGVIAVSVDGGNEMVLDMSAGRSTWRIWTDLARGQHTATIRLVSGTFHLWKFLAI